MLCICSLYVKLPKKGCASGAMQNAPSGKSAPEDEKMLMPDNQTSA